jgi:hypothetical protein
LHYVAVRNMSAALLVLWRLLAALCLLVSVANGYHLRIRVQPGRAAGGTAFEEQPQLELTLADGITLAAAFTGYITAELITGPIGWESEGLWYDVGGVTPSSDPLASQATLTNTRYLQTLQHALRCCTHVQDLI